MLLIYLICLFSFTNIIVHENIMNGFRKMVNQFSDWSGFNFFSDIITCDTCCGFYVGCLLTFLMPATTGFLLLDIIVSGLVGSGINKIINIILLKF